MLMLGYDNCHSSYEGKSITSYHHINSNFVRLKKLDLIHVGIT